MTVYDVSFIQSYYKTIIHENLDININNILDEILTTINNDISLNINELEIDNKFKKKNKLKKYDNYNAKDFSYLSNKNNYRYINTKRKPNIDKNKEDAIKSNIKILLNKLSTSNYNKLESELLTLYGNLLDNNDEDNINILYSIDNYIINYICYNNISCSEIYNNILYSLITFYYNKNYELENIFIYNLFKEKFEEFLCFENYIKSSLKENEYDVNKNNDKYKCFCIFIINFYRKINDHQQVKSNFNNNESNYINDLFLTKSKILEFILLFNNFFVSNLKKDNNKIYCEIILEFLIQIYNELFKEIAFIKNVDNKLEIYNIINNILTESNNFLSFSNKIKFKLMDINDKYKKYIIND